MAAAVADTGESASLNDAAAASGAGGGGGKKSSTGTPVPPQTGSSAPTPSPSPRLSSRTGKTSSLSQERRSDTGSFRLLHSFRVGCRNAMFRR